MKKMNKEYININNLYIPLERANWFWPRFIGLMGKTNINYGIIFPKCNSIHTFFMKEKIDVVAINKQNEIIMIARNLDKNKILNVKNSKKNTSIIELPNNTSKGLKIGQRLILIRK
jgi:uncharacterized membrane protein (UPF0127 family)